jgi:hypothetical protein
MKIKAYISQKHAILAKFDKFGDIDIEVNLDSIEDVSFLEYLAKNTQNNLNVATADVIGLYKNYTDYKRETEEKEAAEKIVAEQNASVKAQKENERKKIFDENLALETAKKVQLEKYVLENCTAIEIAQYKDNFFGDSDIINRITDHAFFPMSNFKAYKKMMAADIDHVDYCDGTDLSLDVEIMTNLDTDQYKKLIEIKKTLADCTVIPQLRTCSCDQCHESMSRQAFNVIKKVGVLELTRLFDM